MGTGNWNHWNRVSQRGSRTNERSIRYGGKIRILWCHWLKLLVENSQTPKKCQSQLCVYSPVSTLCPVPGYDVGKIQKLELYDYLTLFQYPWSCHSIRIIRTAKSAVHLDSVLKMTGLWKNGIFTVISNHLTILCVWCAMLRNTCIREKMCKIYLNWWHNWASTENVWFGDEYGSVKLENYPWTSTDQGSWIPHCSRYC